MPTKFFTNNEQNTLLKKFEGTLKNIQNLYYFDALVNYILYVKSREEDLQSGTSNEEISGKFEELIDAMVMELYFAEEFHAKDLYFIDFAKEFTQDISEKTNAEKSEIILEAYNYLNNPSNNIYRNLQYLEKKLPDIVGVIKRYD